MLTGLALRCSSSSFDIFARHRLNLLIAIMGDSYEKVKESEHVEAMRERARIIVEQEKRFPKSQRYHRFMHFLEAADSAGMCDDREWAGVTNRVSQMLSEEAGRLDTKMDNKFDLLEREVGRLDTKVDSQLSMMDTKFGSLERKLEMILDRLK